MKLKKKMLSLVIMAYCPQPVVYLNKWKSTECVVFLKTNVVSCLCLQVPDKFFVRFNRGFGCDLPFSAVHASYGQNLSMGLFKIW